MKILLAEDDLSSRTLLSARLSNWGYQVLAAANGSEAWTILKGENAPQLAVLDWMMPELDGLEVCRRLRSSAFGERVYAIVLTAREGGEDLIEAFEAGADDFLTKPVDKQELEARLRVGTRIIDLQNRLAQRVRDLEASAAEIRQLQGILPICSYCKKIRGDEDYWQEVEAYISIHSETQFSHGICPSCFEEHVTPSLSDLRSRGTV